MSEHPYPSLDRTESRTPRSDGAESLYLRLLRKTEGTDLSGLAKYCQHRRQHLRKQARKERYEDAGIAVALIYAIRDSDEVRDRFADAFENEFGREPKPDKKDREVFLFLYGEARMDLAGTDAIALAEAIRRGISPRRIPAFIEFKGGLEKMLKAERARRDPLLHLENVELWCSKNTAEQLMKIPINGRANATLIRRDDEDKRSYILTISK